jgi:hypothetical protein
MAHIIDLSAAQSGDFKAILVNDGDSLSAKLGSETGVTFMTFAVAKIPQSPISTQNVAISGQTLAQMVVGFSEHITPLYQPSLPFIVHLMAGTNDIRAGANAETIARNLKRYVNLIHELGANAKIVLATSPLQCDIFRNPAQRAALQSVNDLLIARSKVPQEAGGFGADGLANYWADPTIGPNSYSASAFCDRAYSIDGQHGTDLTKGIMGTIEAAAIAPLL